MKKKKWKRRPRLTINVKELDVIMDSSGEKLLTIDERDKVKAAIHLMAEQLIAKPKSEKQSDLLDGADGNPTVPDPTPPEDAKDKPKKPGHGRNGADAFTGAKRVPVSHPDYTSGCPCPDPECTAGKLYPRKNDPSPLLRIIGMAPLQATVYELEKLRCNVCDKEFIAPPPPGIGLKKYDETAASMVGVLKYGLGMPFNRIGKLQHQLGMPLPPSTQWELVEDAAALMKPVHHELIRQGAQGGILHNDDTLVRILEEVPRPPTQDDDRTGLFTTSIICEISEGRKVSLFFSGPQHAGENLRDVLEQRAKDLEPAVVMSDALSRNLPHLAKGIMGKVDGEDPSAVVTAEGIKLLWANCLAHGRRQFVGEIENFPDECRHILVELGKVYWHDEQAREKGLNPKDRLKFHQEHSGPVMTKLHVWLSDQLKLKLVEPNSGLGKAIKYLLTHWNSLTLFLRHAGAVLDNNICERAIKKAVLHRKNCLFFKTLNGARVGDCFMSIIHICELNGVDAFHYMTEVQRHAPEAALHPSLWMPWNYHLQLTPVPTPPENAALVPD